MDEEEGDELREAEEVCKRFLAWDLQTGPETREDVREKLGQVLGRVSEEEEM